MGSHVWTGAAWMKLHPADEHGPVGHVVAPGGRDQPQAPVSPSNAKPNRTPLALVAAGLAAVVLLIAGAVLLRLMSSPTHDVAGSFKFQQDYGYCEGAGGYSDIGPMTQATLYDGSGVVLATTTLGPGQQGTSTEPCEYTFTFYDVPERDFYQFEVAERGKLKISLAEMKANGWSVGGTLG